MKLLETCKNQRIQDRNIDISSYSYDDDHIVVSGELLDRRLVATFSSAGERREPGIVHHMQICMKVETASLSIVEIEARMAEVPHDECPRMVSSVEKIQGLTISPGFTSIVKKRLGGLNGCIHLTTLLLSMAPAVMQGYWTHGHRNVHPPKVSDDELEQYLVDTCWVWRREGPLVGKVKGLGNGE